MSYVSSNSKKQQHTKLRIKTPNLDSKRRTLFCLTRTSLIITGLFASTAAFSCIDNNNVAIDDGSTCEYGPNSPYTETKTVDGVEYTAFIALGPSRSAVYISGEGSTLNMHGHSYIEMAGGGTRNGVWALNGGVINVDGNLYTKTYNSLNSRALVLDSPKGGTVNIKGDLFAYRSGTGGSTTVEVSSYSHLTVEGNGYMHSDSNPMTHVFRQYGTSKFLNDLTIAIERDSSNSSDSRHALRNAGNLDVGSTLTILAQDDIGILQQAARTSDGPKSIITANKLNITTTRRTDGTLSHADSGDAYHVEAGLAQFAEAEVNAAGKGIVFLGSSGNLNLGMEEPLVAPSSEFDATLAIGSKGSIKADKQAIVFDGPANSYTLIAENAQVTGEEGLYLKKNGNATLEIQGGARVKGSITMGDGSDTLIVNGNVDFSNVATIDGGDSLSATDGFVDDLVFKNSSFAISGDKLVNWEKVTLDNSTLSFSSQSLDTGSEESLGVFVTNGSTLIANNSFALNGNLHVQNNSNLHIQGGNSTRYTINDNLYNAGTITLNDNSSGTLLEVNGNYIGQNGTIAIDTTLGPDNSPTDLIHILGNSSGTSKLHVTNQGGLGELTTADGIRVIHIDGLSEGSFSLLGDYTHNERAVVVGGAYAYSLHHGGKETPLDGHWYLRSELAPTEPEEEPSEPTTPQTPPPPSYQAGAPVYEVYPQFLLGMNRLPTLQQRVGNRSWSNISSLSTTDQGSPINASLNTQNKTFVEGDGLWGRVESEHSKFRAHNSTTDSRYKYTTTKLQLGVDHQLSENSYGKTVGGVNIHYLHGTAKIHSPHGDGKIKTNGYGIGATLTWYGNNNLYVDNQANFTLYKSDLDSRTARRALVHSNTGRGYALSSEIGKRYTLNEHWTLTPQAQLTYSHASFNTFKDAFGAEVTKNKAYRLEARAGLSANYQNAWVGPDNKVRRNTAYTIINYLNELSNKSRVKVSGVPMTRKDDRQWVELGVGGTYNWKDDKYSLYGEVAARSSIEKFGKSYGLQGIVGVRARW